MTDDGLTCPGCDSPLCPDCVVITLPLLALPPQPHRVVPVLAQDLTRPIVTLPATGGVL